MSTKFSEKFKFKRADPINNHIRNTMAKSHQKAKNQGSYKRDKKRFSRKSLQSTNQGHF